MSDNLNIITGLHGDVTGKVDGVEIISKSGAGVFSKLEVRPVLG